MRNHLTAAVSAGFLMIGTSTFGVGVAHADVLMQASDRTACLDMGSGSGRIASCNGGYSQNFLTPSGEQRYNGRCLQGTGGNNATNTLSLRNCNGSRDQQWAIARNGNYVNSGGWCAAVTQYGTVIAAQCYGGGTYAWSTGRIMSLRSAGSNAAKLAYLPAGAAVNSSGSLVARGNVSIAGIVAQGGGNIVAQGGGNIVAQGGGNVVATTGGSIVAQGGGN